MGFVASGEAAGRGGDSAPLTHWWMDFGHPDLFSATERSYLAGKLCLVIDANIFYGLYSDDKDDAEAKSLIADWLPDNIELCLTDEIFNEIDRQQNIDERTKNRQLAQSFSKILYDSTKVANIENELQKLIPESKNESSRSDIRHLAKAILGDSLYFITRDKDILKYSDVLYEKFQISVLQPCDMIIQLDQIERGHEYQPARLHSPV